MEKVPKLDLYCQCSTMSRYRWVISRLSLMGLSTLIACAYSAKSKNPSLFKSATTRKLSRMSEGEQRWPKSGILNAVLHCGRFSSSSILTNDVIQIEISWLHAFVVVAVVWMRRIG